MDQVDYLRISKIRLLGTAEIKHLLHSYDIFLSKLQSAYFRNLL